MFGFEHRSESLASRQRFLNRVATHGGAAVLVVALSLGTGTAGYHVTEGIPWLDALLNAAMILTGMGPVAVLQTTAGKLFATGYALYSGVVFLLVAGLLTAPFLHRLLHRLHLDASDDRAAGPPAA